MAGRTDTGVDATGQGASFATSASCHPQFAERLNAVLARDVAITVAVPAADDFDRRAARRGRRVYLATGSWPPACGTHSRSGAPLGGATRSIASC